MSPTTGQTGSAPVAVGGGAASATSGGQAAAPRRLGLALVVIAAAQLMVVLDATIVNVALPHIQDALHFSGTNLEWVVNAYTLAFGGLLLLGGRMGDLLGRRRIFIAGIALFAIASLAGGFATDQAWLLTARVIQGIGGALAAPASLSLIAVTFPEGKERNRAMGVYAGVSISGAAIGLIAGGLLTSYLDWRWVFFVNVPIGLILVLLAPRVIGESERTRGKFDLPGAITGSLGLGALVYGLSEAATTFSQRPGDRALGEHQGHRLAGGGGGAARHVRVHRGTVAARAGAAAGAEVPRPDRGLPDQPVHRHRDLRHVLLHDDLRAGGLALLAGPLGDRVPADGRPDRGRGGALLAAGRAGSARGR